MWTWDFRKYKRKILGRGSEVKWKSLSHVQLLVTLRTIQSMGFSRSEYWSGKLFLSPGNLSKPGTEPSSPALQADSLSAEPQGKNINTQWNLNKWSGKINSIIQTRLIGGRRTGNRIRVGCKGHSQLCCFCYIYSEIHSEESIANELTLDKPLLYLVDQCVLTYFFVSLQIFKIFP